jgi:hypothetical protein
MIQSWLSLPHVMAMMFHLLCLLTNGGFIYISTRENGNARHLVRIRHQPGEYKKGLVPQGRSPFIPMVLGQSHELFGFK